MKNSRFLLTTIFLVSVVVFQFPGHPSGRPGIGQSPPFCFRGWPMDSLAGEKPQPARTPKFITEGKLTQKDKRQSHLITLRKGYLYRIDLESKDFDTFLWVRDSSDKYITHDDDSGEKLNSRIFFFPPDTGTYKLVVGSYHEGMIGEYVVKAVEYEPKGKPIRFDGKLTKSDKTIDMRYFKEHKEKFQTGEIFVIKLTSASDEIDPYLIVKDAKGKTVAEDDDSGGGFNAQIIFLPPQSGTYHILATTFRPATAGGYSLNIQRYSLTK